ncbi:MAG: aminotransferase class III-fold pyridoxal phosphate-dependent enzyme, partial [Vulcanimicrobiaceae bacterium]
LGDFASARHLFHGHSFAANPIASAAALASLELFDREHTLSNAVGLSQELEQLLLPLASHRAVREIRRAGLMCAIELDIQALALPDEPTRAWTVANRLYERGHFTRPLGDAIQLVPPLASSVQELTSFCASLHAVLDEVTR